MRVVLGVLAVLAAGFLFYSYGTAFPPTPFAPLQLDEPVAADSDGVQTVIADGDSRRVLILNADGQLTGMIDCTSLDSPVAIVTDVCVSDGLIYIAGATLEPDSEIVKQERVAVYGKGGGLLGIAYEREGKGAESLAVRSLSDAPGGVVVAVDEQASGISADGVSANLSFVYANLDGSEQVEAGESGLFGTYDAGYDSGAGTYAMLSNRGMLNDVGDVGAAAATAATATAAAERSYADHLFSCVDTGVDKTIYVVDGTDGALYRMADGGELEWLADSVGGSNLHVNGNLLMACDREGGTVKLIRADGTLVREITEVAPSAGFALRSALVWVSAAYLVLLVLAYAVRKARQAIASGSLQGVGPLLASVAVAIAFGAAVGGLSIASYNASIETRSNEIDLCANYLAMQARELSEAVEVCTDRNVLRDSGENLATTTDMYQKAQLPAFELVSAANESGIGMFFNLYARDDLGVFYLAGSADENIVGTSSLGSEDRSVIEAAFESVPAPEGETVDTTDQMYVGRTLRDTTLYRIVKIPTSDGTGVAGVLQVGSKMRSLEDSLIATLAQRLVALLVVMLVVYLSYRELRACGRCFFVHRQLRERGAVDAGKATGGESGLPEANVVLADRARVPGDAIAMLTRPFTFCITILQSIDGVMTVLIARDMLNSAGLNASGALLAVPAVMLGLGLVVGQMLYGRLGGRVGLRRLMAGGSLAMLACAALTAASVFSAAVFSGAFWLYCVAKFAMAIPFGLLYSLGYSLPRMAERVDVRAQAAGGVKRTDTSAAALGTVLGGYVAQTLGNAWVYVLVALACIPVALMALSLLPKGIRPLERERRRSDVFRFVRGKTALSLVLFVVLPATIAAGYTSFLFPLFSSDLGLTKADVNNIYVLGQLVVYVCISRIDAVEARFGKQRVATFAIASLGIVFLLFSLNTTLAWSVAVVAIVGVLCKASDGWKGLWLAAAEGAGINAGSATGAMFAARSLALVVQPFALGALLGVTDAAAVIAIGAFCVVCAALFGRVIRGDFR